MSDRFERVMVVTAHPDDAEFGAAGTIAKLVQEGCEVTYVIVTNGNKGSNDRHVTPSALAETRVAEQRQAARTLGVERVEFLDYPDGEVEDTRALGATSRADPALATRPPDHAELAAHVQPLRLAPRPPRDRVSSSTASTRSPATTWPSPS